MQFFSIYNNDIFDSVSIDIFAFSCVHKQCLWRLHYIVVAYNIIFDSVSINAVHLYLSVLRSIDGGPAFSTRENLVPRFPVPRFLPMRFGPAFSSPAYSTHAIWSHVFQSHVFHPRTCHGPPFSIPAFSASPTSSLERGVAQHIFTHASLMRAVQH